MSFTPYLYEKRVRGGIVKPIEFVDCLVEDDVWIGHGAIVLPGASHIGRGAAIGAGAVVTKNVPSYAIVAGNPAKVIRQRFSDKVIDEIEKLQWWTWSPEQLVKFANENPDFVFGLSRG